MKIAVLSDIHDNKENLEKALKLVKQNKCEAIIFCGDYAAPPSFKALAEAGLPVYAVFGNVDGAHYEIMRMIQENKYQVKQEKDLLEVELDSKKVAACHRSEFAEGLAATGKYDFVFHGHEHERREKKIGKTLSVCPGSIKEDPSFYLFDTKTNMGQFVKVLV